MLVVWRWWCLTCDAAVSCVLCLVLLAMAQGLEPDDLPSHLHRVYLHGHNQPYSPTFMDPIVPVELQTIVKHAEYAEYAEPCNRAGAWARWELRVMWALALLYYPTAPAFAAWVRKRHMQRVLRHHLTYDHAFLRNTRARSLANSLKFGVSSCDTLAWVDVLCMQVCWWWLVLAALLAPALCGCVTRCHGAERGHGRAGGGPTPTPTGACVCRGWLLLRTVPLGLGGHAGDRGLAVPWQGLVGQGRPAEQLATHGGAWCLQPDP